jgi:hypothetical protein
MRLRLFLLLFVAGFCCGGASGQVLTVQLMNGKTRKPLKSFRIYVYLGATSGQPTFDLKTNREGKVSFDPGKEQSFQLVTVGTVSCNPQASVTSHIDFNVDDVAAHGVVTRNDCGSFKPEPSKGQLTVLTGSASALELFRN